MRLSVHFGAVLATALLFSNPAFAEQKPEPRGKVTAERYEIDVRFEPEEGWLAAKAAVTLRAGEYTEAIEFELNPRLEIKEITDAQGRKLAWDRSRRIGSAKLLVRLAEPAAAGANEGITLTFAYEGAPLLRGLDYITKDGILLRDESRWYPAVDLAAFTQNEIRAQLPNEWVAAWSGDNQDFTLGKPSADLNWYKRATVSSRSLAAFNSNSLGCQEWMASPHPEMWYGLSFCYRKGGESAWESLAKAVDERLRYMSDWFGRYSQSSFHLIQGFPGQQGAIGYSAPGFLVVSEDVVKFSGDPNYMPEFLPHEIAHQWFPIEVTLEQQEDGWLAESLAEYLAWRYLQEKQPEAARTLVARAMRDALALEPPPPLSQGLRMFALHDWEVTYASLYQRGMLVWRTLETVIGRQRVDRALREYYKRFAGRSASVADFRKICEEISERDLNWFFDYFLGGTQIPEIEIRRVPTAAPNEYGGEIVVGNVPPEFTARVEMKLYTNEGVVEHSVATRGEVTPFTVNVPGTVTRVVLDPEARILRWTEAARRHRGQRALLAQAGDAEEDDDLAKAVELLGKALEADPGDVAQNAQLVHFQMGRLLYRRNLWSQAAGEFRQALETRALDPSADAFYRAWARVFLARIARRQGFAARARKEAAQALTSKSAALETRIQWPGAEREESAREALQTLARPSAGSRK